MVKFIIATFIFIITSIFTFGQDYPRKAIIGPDTVAILKIDQVRIINGKLIDLRKVNEENKELNSMVSLYKLSNQSLNNQVFIQDSIINTQSYQIDNYKNLNESISKKYDKQKKRSLILGGMSIALGISTILTLIIK